jgi:hypothetical protein
VALCDAATECARAGIFRQHCNERRTNLILHSASHVLFITIPLFILGAEEQKVVWMWPSFRRFSFPIRCVC